MIHFFRDILDGPVYIVVSIICILLIIGILGFMIEKLRKKSDSSPTVKDVDTAISLNTNTLVISSNHLEEDKQVSLDSIEEPVSLEVIGEDSEGVLDDLFLEKNTLSSTNDDLNTRMPDVTDEEIGVLSINSDDVQVSEVETLQIAEQPKVTSVKTVIDFGSTNDVEIDKE